MTRYESVNEVCPNCGSRETYVDVSTDVLVCSSCKHEEAIEAVRDPDSELQSDTDSEKDGLPTLTE